MQQGYLLKLLTLKMPKPLPHTHCRWWVFEEWCGDGGTTPFQCSMVDVLLVLDKGRTFSTFTVYFATISACHVGFGDKSVGQYPLVCRFMKGASSVKATGASVGFVAGSGCPFIPPF